MHIRRRCDAFQVLEPMEGFNFSISGLLHTMLAVVARSAGADSPALASLAALPPHPPYHHQHSSPQASAFAASAAAAPPFPGPQGAAAAPPPVLALPPAGSLGASPAPAQSAGAPLMLTPAHSGAAGGQLSPALTYVRGQFDLATVEASLMLRAASLPTGAAPQVPGVPNGTGAAPQQQQEQPQQQYQYEQHGGAAASPASRGEGRRRQGVAALFLPRNTDLRQLASLVPAGAVWQVERNYVNRRLKGITFYCFA